MTIGIPRALLYWKNPHLWETFFENLGEKIILSPKTNKEIIERGTKFSDPETCFSIKVFFGHLLWLDGKCDFIFVPRLKTNYKRLEYCPKFFGIPDLSKILVKTPILTEVFNGREEKWKRAFEKIGGKLNKGAKTIKKATNLAFLRQEELEKEKERDFSKKIKSKKRKIVLISHQYNLYDEYVNVGIKKKLEALGAEPIFIDQIPIGANRRLDRRKSASNIEFHWEFGEEIMEAIQELLKCKIDGAVEISSFQCGCDAVLKEFVEKEFKQRKIPFLYLIIDEQTGEAGIQTRLEAFMDTL